MKVSVTDTGIGIPRNAIDKIFDPYFSTKSKGSGLGLAICHSIITKHNGRISVESQPGKGTTFTIVLPASDKAKEKHIQEQEVVKKGQKARVMIMDDEDMVRDVARAMLEQIGHDVILAKDGAEAIEFFKISHESKAPIDLIIMDLTIPGGMGGKEAVAEVLKIDKDAKVIVASGYSTDPIMAAYEEYGFCSAIVKPFQFPELSSVVNKALA